MAETGADQALTAIVRRRIKSGAEADFEAMMQEWVAVMIRHPGHLGINMIRPAPGSRDYTVLNRFATEADRRRFTGHPDYLQWMSRLREVSESEPEIEEQKGLAFWFTLPGRPARHPPPRLKMALLTLLGVYPLTMLIPRLVVHVTPDWPHWLRALLVAMLIVASLTWVIMPNLTRLFEPWLFPPDKKG